MAWQRGRITDPDPLAHGRTLWIEGRPIEGTFRVFHGADVGTMETGRFFVTNLTIGRSRVKVQAGMVELLGEPTDFSAHVAFEPWTDWMARHGQPAARHADACPFGGAGVPLSGPFPVTCTCDVGERRP